MRTLAKICLASHLKLSNNCKRRKWLPVRTFLGRTPSAIEVLQISCERKRHDRMVIVLIWAIRDSALVIGVIFRSDLLRHLRDS